MSENNGESRMDRFERDMEDMKERNREMMGQIQALHVNIESLHDSVGQLHASAQRDGENIRQLYATAVRDGENIRALVRIAEAHERRLSDLEGGSS